MTKLFQENESGNRWVFSWIFARSEKEVQQAPLIPHVLSIRKLAHAKPFSPKSCEPLCFACFSRRRFCLNCTCSPNSLCMFSFAALQEGKMKLQGNQGAKYKQGSSPAFDQLLQQFFAEYGLADRTAGIALNWYPDARAKRHSEGRFWPSVLLYIYSSHAPPNQKKEQKTKHTKHRSILVVRAGCDTTSSGPHKWDFVFESLIFGVWTGNKRKAPRFLGPPV